MSSAESHAEILATYAVVSIATAAAILGGDAGPVSAGTVYRLIAAGELEKRGKGKVGVASLRRYLDEGPRQQQPAPPRASTSRPARQAPAAATGEVPDWQRLIRYPKCS